MGMDLVFDWFLYAGILGGVVLIYLVISSILTGKIKKIVPAEVSEPDDKTCYADNGI